MKGYVSTMLKRMDFITVFTGALIALIFTVSLHFSTGGLFDSVEQIFVTSQVTDIIVFFILWIVVSGLFILFSKVQRLVVLFKRKKDLGIRWFVIPFALIAGYYLFYTLCFFPGTILPDTMGSISQILNGPETLLSNHHPILFTSWLNLWVKLAALVSPNINYGIFLAVIVQQVLIAIGFASTIYWCARHNVRRWILIGMTVIYGLFPHFPMFATALWKDPLFSFGILMLTLVLASLCVDRIKETRIWCVMVGTISFLIMAFRNNGLYVMVITFLVLLILKRKQYGLTKGIIGITITLYLLVSGPLYSYLEIEKPSVEAMAIPLQQTGYNLKYNSEVYSQDQLDTLDQIMPIEVWQASYTPRIVDEIKWNPEWNDEVFQKNITNFLKVWASHIFDSFDNYVLSYLMATQGFWDPIKQMNHEYYADMVIDNDFGIYRTTLKDRIGIDVVPPISLFQPLVGAGSCAWSIVFFLFVGIRKHGNKMVLPYIPSLALWLTLLVATPLAFGMRYALPLAFTLPFLMVLPYIPVNLKQAEQTNNYSIKVIIHNVVLSMIGPVCFVLSIFFLIETRDEFHLVSYSDQQQVIGLTQDTYLEQHMNFTQDFDLNRISLWTQTDTSEQSEAYSIYLALLNEAGTVIWQADVSSTQLNADPLNPWTLFYCNDVHIEPGNYVLQIHGNGENELSGLVVGPVYQDEKVVEPLIINGYPSDLYINLKVIG